jgi:hypothetical protein
MEDLIKALDAGSALASPSNLTQGAALGKQNLSRKMHAAGQKPTGSPIKPPTMSRPDAGFGKITHKSEKLSKGAGQASASPQHRGQGSGPSVGVHDEYETRGHAIHGAMRSAGFPSSEANAEHKIRSKKKLGELRSMPKPNLPKSEDLQRAEQEYQNWSKREQFEAFMKSRMPNLTKGEIIAIGQTIALNKSTKMEKALERVAPSMHSSIAKNKK